MAKTKIKRLYLIPILSKALDVIELLEQNLGFLEVFAIGGLFESQLQFDLALFTGFGSQRRGRGGSRGRGHVLRMGRKGV